MSDPGHAFGIDIGGSGVKGAEVDLATGELVYERIKIATPHPATPNAVAEGIKDDQAIEKLVVQICYRAADLAFLLERDGTPLNQYSEQLRREPDETLSDEDLDEDV